MAPTSIESPTRVATSSIDIGDMAAICPLMSSGLLLVSTRTVDAFHRLRVDGEMGRSGWNGGLRSGYG
jgi:hypothetical protein